MTAPTPELAPGPMWTLAVSAARAEMESYGPVTTGHPESLWDETSDMPESVTRAVANVYLPALAAVTAERDDARREVEHQKWIKEQNTAALVEQLEQARQMLADAQKRMANARAVAEDAGLVNYEEDNYAAGARDVAEELGEAGL